MSDESEPCSDPSCRCHCEVPDEHDCGCDCPPAYLRDGEQT